MPQYRYDINQNSEEWEDIKLGMFSASSAADLLMDKKNQGYKNLIDKIIEERITGSKSESSSFKGNQFTERGHELEPVAREDYEFRYFKEIVLVGVVIMDEWSLCSPDGLISSDTVHQIKCPIFNTQRKYLKLIEKHFDLSDNDKLKKLNSSYYKQEQFELFITDRHYAVFTSYHPHLPPIDLVIERDEVMIREIKTRLKEAIEEVKQEINQLNTK